MKVKNKQGQEMTVTFAESFFEDFEGTPEEMEELLATISEMIADGSLFEKSIPFSMDELDEDEAEELMEQMRQAEKRSIVH